MLRGIADAKISDRYSEISGLGVKLQREKVKTAATNGLTSGPLTQLIDELRSVPAKSNIINKNNGVIKGITKNIGYAPTDDVIVTGNYWESGEVLCDKIQDLINNPKDESDSKIDILLPQVVMKSIPSVVRKKLAYDVANMLFQIRELMLEAAFPGALELLGMVNERTRNPDNGLDHADMKGLLSKK